MKVNFAQFVLPPLLVFGLENVVLSQEQVEGQQDQRQVESSAAKAEPKVVVERASASVEKIQVTGSHIKRIQIEGPSPVLVLDKEYIEKTGAISVADVLRGTTASSYGAPKEQSGSNAAGVAHVSLRGLGASRTLVLVDGKRLPADAVTGAVDLNLIPMAAVERIEILKDGASATYGSDALAGVVNIITKKNYNGAEFSTKHFFSEKKGGKKSEYSLVAGSSSDKVSATVVVQYRKSDPVYSRDRKFSKDGLSTLGSPGSYRTRTSGSGGVTSGPWKADPNCPADKISVQGDNQFCQFKYADFSTTYPELDHLGVLASFKYEFKDDLTLYSRIGASRKRASWEYAPAPGIFNIPASVASTLGPSGGVLPGAEATDDIQVRYRTIELGNRKSEIETTAFNVLVGARGNIFDNWDWDISASQNRVRRFSLSVSGYALLDNLTGLIEDGDFNPFAAAGNRGDLNSAFYQPWEESVATNAQYEARISGELFELPAGALSVAFGMAASKETFSDQTDNMSVQGNVFGNAGSNGSGSRSSHSAFIETVIPAFERFELQLAGRYDNYNDFGSTFNPKVAASYNLANKVLFRASWGTGFKAPSLVDQHAAQSEGYPFIIDKVKCEADKATGQADPTSCAEQQYKVLGGGNPGLKEEKSDAFNFGVLYEPLQNLSIGIDYWGISLDKVVGINYDDLIEAEFKGSAAAQALVTRDSNGEIEEIDGQLSNLASEVVSGIDAELSYAHKTSFGVFGFGNSFSYILFDKSEGFPGVGEKDKIGERGMPQWKNTVTLGYEIKENDFTFVIRTLAGTEKSIPEEGDLPAHTEVDFQYSYDTPWRGKVIVGATNVFANDPPLDDSSPQSQLDETIYDQIGRAFYAGYVHVF